MQMDDAFFDAESKRFEQMIEVYTPQLEELRATCDMSSIRREFSVGGIHLHRGYYCPSPIQDIVIGNAKRGKILKRLTKRSKPDCEFGFDDHDQLVFAHSSFGNEIILREGAKEIGVVSDEDGIHYISECEYENGRIKKYALAEYSFSYPKQVTFINMEVYTYTGDTFVTDWYRWMRPTRDALRTHKHLSEMFGHASATWHEHNQFVFTLQNGYLLEYIFWQYDGDHLRGSPYNDGMTYQVCIERKV